jgi:hypothetical protein
MKTFSAHVLKLLSEKATKNWRVRSHPVSEDEFIVEADKLDPNHPYHVQVFGEDRHPELYPPHVARADAELACLLRNNVDKIIELLEDK